MTVVAITGAGGFIGRELVRSTMEAGWKTRSLGRGDLGNGLADRLRGCDAVVHLAARAHVVVGPRANDLREFERVNVELSRRVAASARTAGVRRLVFVSSAGVLGRSSPPGGFDDSSPPRPHDAYTRSKLSAEEALRNEFADDLELVIIRPPMVYGPDAPGNFGRLLRLVERRWPVPLGALSAQRSMVGLRNVCDLLRVVVVHPRAPAGRFLVADDETRSVAELVRDIARVRGQSARLMNVPEGVLRGTFRIIGRAKDMERLAAPFVIRARTVRERLGWIPPHGFEEELTWTLRAGGST